MTTDKVTGTFEDRPHKELGVTRTVKAFRETATNTDLSSKSIKQLRRMAPGHDDLLHDCVTGEAADELARRLKEAQQKIVAQEAKDNYVGRWLSAALDDPSVCEEMKADIRLWMASDAIALTAHDAEVAAEAKAEALEDTATELAAHIGEGKYIVSRIMAKAAEYRAKAKGEKP